MDLHRTPTQEPLPFGDMALAPAGLTGLSEAELARSMAAHLQVAAPGSGAEALRFLRRSFPSSSLSMRAAALAFMMRR